MAQVIPGSFSRTDRGLVSIGNGEYVDAQSPEGRAMTGFTGSPTRYMPGSSFASQGFTPEEGRASMGLAPTQQEKYNSSIEAMKQFNLDAFERAAPGTLFGQGDSGFQSPAMKVSKMGFNNIYNSLFGGGLNNY
tara:strand:+ start:1129 stop:1530 length:402 start_codon:yes stop_codon:yes gene_type:complete